MRPNSNVGLLCFLIKKFFIILKFSFSLNLNTQWHMSVFKKINILSFLFVWLHHAACGILVPRPGIEPAPPAVEVLILNHCTAREVLTLVF